MQVLLGKRFLIAFTFVASFLMTLAGCPDLDVPYEAVQEQACDCEAAFDCQVRNGFAPDGHFWACQGGAGHGVCVLETLPQPPCPKIDCPEKLPPECPPAAMPDGYIDCATRAQRLGTMCPAMDKVCEYHEAIGFCPDGYGPTLRLDWGSPLLPGCIPSDLAACDGSVDCCATVGTVPACEDASTCPVTANPCATPRCFEGSCELIGVESGTACGDGMVCKGEFCEPI